MISSKLLFSAGLFDFVVYSLLLFLLAPLPPLLASRVGIKIVSFIGYPTMAAVRTVSSLADVAAEFQALQITEMNQAHLVRF